MFYQQMLSLSCSFEIDAGWLGFVFTDNDCGRSMQKWGWACTEGLPGSGLSVVSYFNNN
jgi:hypothetical protein